ncbi:hypothetical protein [Oceanobacillus indicireducens]|uniref:Uncharacterized protein n=1 Tax=Oceanobacillus indicireducens TaxID=1004261 RepID=A0A917XYC2_9BACI|nr:hypothetical protein [Oceanobacillus indicireducens]GGN59445.1 hypothetical protein GCM10007971_22590 [Oceanobacillus indicireducens]
MNKTVSIDGHKYQVTASHDPNILFPFRYRITITYKNEIVKSTMFNNAGAFPLVRLVEEAVRGIHTEIFNQNKRLEAQNRFEKEFKEWDGVINI